MTLPLAGVYGCPADERYVLDLAFIREPEPDDEDDD